MTKPMELVLKLNRVLQFKQPLLFGGALIWDKRKG